MEQTLSALGLSQYDRGARLAPALLVLMPLFLLAAVWLPDFWSLMVGFAALGLFGGGYLMMGVARSSGLKVERRIEGELGARPTTICLRHGNDWLNVDTRDRYHSALRKLGLRIPSHADQNRFPEKADAAYASAVDRLRELTRTDDHKMVLSENIHYGFRRNLRGLKRVAVAVILTCLCLDVLSLFMSISSSDKQLYAAIGLAAVYLSSLLVWLLVINDRFVSEAGWSYARRLLSSCENLKDNKK